MQEDVIVQAVEATRRKVRFALEDVEWYDEKLNGQYDTRMVPLLTALRDDIDGLLRLVNETLYKAGVMEEQA